MSEKQVVGPDLTPDWFRKYDRIISEINSQLARGLETPGTGLTLDNLQAVVEHRNPFAAVISPEAPLAEWYNFYRAEFGIELDITSIRIPERRKGFDRLIVIAGNLKIQQVYDRCKSVFPCWKYTDRNLDEAVPTNNRDSKDGTYAIWIRDRVEADDELKNLSANILKDRSIAGITLLERLVFELKYFRETGKHLDISNWTLCSGSRNNDGDVPSLLWFGVDDELGVVCYSPDDDGGRLRSREVVSN